MSIPNNITNFHLKEAAEKIIREGIPSDAHSSTYDVVYEFKLLPPKLIVSYANIFANGTELDRKTFEGGIGTPCFKLLEEKDYVIIRKDSFYANVVRFIEQSKTENLKTTKYVKEYGEYKVKVSFGMGNPAQIPWISILGTNQSTSSGIYPVLLYYKNLNILILAYGISETNKPVQQWSLDDSEPTIKDYFKSKGYKKPKRYGESFVYKVYSDDDIYGLASIDDDLKKLLEEYRLALNIGVKRRRTKYPFNIKTFSESLEISKLVFPLLLQQRFVSSLITKPFVILSGLSGSGKTKLAQAFVQWICADEEQYKIVPVGADWTNREPLLGYPNALEEAKYIRPDNGVVDLILHADENKNLPHFLILDEMNLSHVERYFADFLSVMESNGKVNFHSGAEEKSGVPASVALPDNLFIIGTINVDETTYMFSPKVLDRANVIEFRISEKEIGKFLKNPLKPDLGKLKGEGAGMGENFMQMARNKEFKNPVNGDLNTTLVEFFGELKKTGAEFGYRSAYEIHRLINQLTVIDAEMVPEKKLDIAIMQKLLPKLHGSRRKLCPVLVILGRFCIDEDVIKDIEKTVFDLDDFDFKSEGVLYPLSLEKITRMHKGAVDNGFASYAEA